MLKNIFPYFSFIWIVILLSGCVAKPNPVNIQETPTSVFMPAGTTHVMLQPTATKKPEIDIQPKIEKYCPSEAHVSIDELGLPSNLALFAVDGDQNLGDINQPLRSNIQSFSGSSSLPNKIANLSSTGSELVVGVSLSPSGLLMDILRWQTGDPHMSVWIRTSNGQKEWKVTDVSVRQRVLWISDEEIVVIGAPNEDEYERILEQDMMPLLSINPFTLEIRPLSQLPHGTIFEYGSYHSSKDGNSYSIYYKEGDHKKTHFIFDYSNVRSTPIFSWVDFSDPTAGIAIDPSGSYEVARRAGDGIDFALDLTLEQATANNSYNQFVKHLSMDSHQDLEFSAMIGLTKSGILILTRPANTPDTPKSTPLFLFDPDTNVLKDYCLSVLRSSVYVNFSPDEQFVALTIAEFLDDQEVYKVLVLNLQKGTYTVIEDTKAIGFAVIQ